MSNTEQFHAQGVWTLISYLESEIKLTQTSRNRQNEHRIKQAENGLQSRSSENGKTAVRHYGLTLQ